MMLDDILLMQAHSHAKVSLMLENGEVRDDLTLPSGTDEYDKLAKQIKEDFAEGKEMIVTVLKVSNLSTHLNGLCSLLTLHISPPSSSQAMDIEMINSLKIVQGHCLGKDAAYC